MKNKFLRYLLRVLWIISTLTWALLSTVIQTIIAIVCLILWRKQIKRIRYFRNRIVVTTEGDGYFGGLECAWIVFVSKTENSLMHELGHTVQNAILGPFYLLITIFSPIRYWYRYYLKNKNYSKFVKLEREKPYGKIWFEKTATNWGNYFFNY